MTGGDGEQDVGLTHVWEALLIVSYRCWNFSEGLAGENDMQGALEAAHSCGDKEGGSSPLLSTNDRQTCEEFCAGR